MAPKLTPPPPVNPDTMLALLQAASEFCAAKPWLEMFDRHVVGLTDPITGEMRIATILGNAGELFGVAIYRRTGIRWLLTMLETPDDCMNLEMATTMDALKLEFVNQRELPKKELSQLKTLGFKPSGKGCVWPQFHSALPGWLPWHINQVEAEQLLADIPRLTRFHTLFHAHPDLYENRPMTEIPFLPQTMPNRPLIKEDLDWRPLIVPPESIEPFQVSETELNRLKSLKRAPNAIFEFGCQALGGGTVLEQGRPCYSRASLLVEHDARGLVLGHELSLSIEPFAHSAGSGLVKTLLRLEALPKTLLIDDLRLEAVLEPLCKSLGIDLVVDDELTNLGQASAALDEFMRMR